MFPPITPNLQPVTAQQDPARARPEVAPVTPVAPVAQDASVGLERRPSDEPQDDGYSQRRRRPPRPLAADAQDSAEEADDSGLPQTATLGADGHEEQLPRKGQLIDIEV